MEQPNILIDRLFGVAERGVIRTLLYFDIFHYPLTLEEIIRFHPFHHEESVITDAVINLKKRQLVFKHDCFYSLHGEPIFVQKRMTGNKLAKVRLQTAKLFSRIISCFPFVRGIMLSGSISKDYMDSNSDIDYFIITEPGRLWLTRGLLALFKRLFLFNSHKFFCTNYLIDSESLEIEEQNFYTAIETRTLIPVFGKRLCEKFMIANRWAQDHLPNHTLHKTAFIPERRVGIKKLIEYMFSGAVGEKLDLKFMDLGIRRWKKQFGSQFSHEEFELAFKSKRNVSKNHPRFFQKQVLSLFQNKIEQFEAANKLKLSA